MRSIRSSPIGWRPVPPWGWCVATSASGCCHGIATSIPARIRGLPTYPWPRWRGAGRHWRRVFMGEGEG
jgi:hypothetical protein